MENFKLYKLTQSPLYKLKSKSKASALLRIETKELVVLSKNPPYDSFSKKTGEKTREIDRPREKLKKVQLRIKDLLSRIEIPVWLFSGKKGVSYIDNARYHQKSPYVITCDIKSFYSNCSYEKVFQTFKYIFKMSDDVAWIFVNLLAFKGKIPTGSPSSQIVAFWAYLPTFERINKKISSLGGIFSLYVDDITISSKDPITKKIIQDINYELKKVGHSIKRSKTKYYGKERFKIITGVAISPKGKLRVPNKRRIKLINSLKSNEKSRLSCIGQIRAGQMIEKDFHKQDIIKFIGN